MALSQPQFQTLFETERDRTYRFLVRLCGQRADADDLLQETFLTVWRKREQFNGSDRSGGAYVRRTAYRLYLNDREKWRRRRELAPAQPWKEEVPGQKTAAPAAQLVAHRDALDYLLARMHDAIDALPDAARDAFVLFRCEGMTCAEIAALGNESVSAVESRIRRATGIVARTLAPHRAELPLS